MDASNGPELHVAIREIARQHARLSRLVEELSDVTIKAPDGHLDLEKLREVIDFTEAHFRYEEQVMASAGYRESDHHADTHAQLLADLSRWRDASRAQEIPDLFRAVETLWRWLLEHIDTEDDDLVSWLHYRAAAAA